MSDIDDIGEFVEEGDRFKESEHREDQAVPSRSIDDVVEEILNRKESKHGQVVQYAKYREGYTPTSETIRSLLPGCYDVHADSNCVYAVPAIKQSGLLVELPEMKSSEVIQVVETFWNSEKDYKDGNEFVVGGAAYKAGLLIYGPPGSGKSCTLKIVSNRLVERGGTVFYASGHPAHVASFLTSFSRIEQNRKSIVILEDIDSLIQFYGESIYLEMLDSAKTIDNVLFIATTNYPDKLDPRIYNRPGRFSHVIKIGLPTKPAREAYLKAILKNHKDVDYIVDNSSGFTIDHLTALVNAVYREKKELSSEIERLKKLFKIPKINEDNITLGFGKD